MTVDISNPLKPIKVGGYENYGDSAIKVVQGTAYSVIASGINHAGRSVVQETPDIQLKLHSVDPSNHILDRDADGKLKIRLRFNKDIVSPGNEQYFYVLNSAGKLLPSTVSIVNNDAIVTLQEPTILTVGEVFTLVAETGLKLPSLSIKQH